MTRYLGFGENIITFKKFQLFSLAIKRGDFMLVFESKARPKERWLLIQLKNFFKYYNLGIPKRFPQNMKKP